MASIFPAEIMRRNTEALLNVIEGHRIPIDYPLFSFLDAMLAPSYHRGIASQSSTHRQSFWALALGCPTKQELDAANLMPTFLIVNTASGNTCCTTDNLYSRYMPLPAKERWHVTVLIEPMVTKLKGSLSWLTSEGYIRQSHIELMLSANKGTTAQVYMKDRHIICYMGELYYQGLIRFSMLLPVMMNRTPDPLYEKILMHWLQYTDAKISEGELVVTLSELPEIQEHMRMQRFNTIRDQIITAATADRTSLEQMIARQDQEMHTFLSRYTDALSNYMEYQDRLNGVNARLTEELNEVMDFLKRLDTHPYVKDIQVNDRALWATFSVPLQHFEEDLMRNMIRNTYNTREQSRLFTYLFLTPNRFKFWLSARILLPMFGQTLTADISVPSEYGYPNAHLARTYPCFGNNLNHILRAAKNKDYMLMLSYLVSSVGNINLMDGVIFHHFSEYILMGGKDYASVEDIQNNRRITINELRNFIHNEIAQEDEQLRIAEQARRNPAGAGVPETPTEHVDTPLQPQGPDLEGDDDRLERREAPDPQGVRPTRRRRAQEAEARNIFDNEDITAAVAATNQPEVDNEAN